MGGITNDVLRNIYQSDQEIYPAPLSYERLGAWVDAAPETCLCFFDEVSTTNAQLGREQGGVVGTIIALPLNYDAWNALIHGHLKETDVDVEYHFVGIQGPVGLHVFHIERNQAETGHGLRVRGFAEFALESAVEAIRARGHTVIGVSGK